METSQGALHLRPAIKNELLSNCLQWIQPYALEKWRQERNSTSIWPIQCVLCTLLHPVSIHPQINTDRAPNGLLMCIRLTYVSYMHVQLYCNMCVCWCFECVCIPFTINTVCARHIDMETFQCTKIHSIIVNGCLNYTICTVIYTLLSLCVQVYGFCNQKKKSVKGKMKICITANTISSNFLFHEATSLLRKASILLLETCHLFPNPFEWIIFVILRSYIRLRSQWISSMKYGLAVQRITKMGCESMKWRNEYDLPFFKKRIYFTFFSILCQFFITFNESINKTKQNYGALFEETK